MAQIEQLTTITNKKATDRAGTMRPAAAMAGCDMSSVSFGRRFRLETFLHVITHPKYASIYARCFLISATT